MTSTAAFTCPSCGFRFRVRDKFLGQIAECPADDCAQKMRLNPPAVEQSDSAPSESFDEAQEVVEQAAAAVVEPEAAEVKPTTVEFSAVNPDSVISGVASPSESRRVQRALRRRATAKPPRVEVEKKAIDPRYIGFGAVMTTAVLGWVVWLFVGEAEVIDTKAPAAELPPIRVEESSQDSAALPKPAVFLVGLSNQPQDSSESLKKKSCPI